MQLSLLSKNYTLTNITIRNSHFLEKNQIAIERFNNTVIEIDIIKNFLPTPD